MLVNKDAQPLYKVVGLCYICIIFCHQTDSDYGAKNYDAQLGRCHSVDVFADTTPNALNSKIT